MVQPKNNTHLTRFYDCPKRNPFPQYTCTQLCLCIRKSSRLKSNDEHKCRIMTHRRVLCNMNNHCGMERELLSIPCSTSTCLNRIYRQSLVKIKQVFWWAHAHASNYSWMKSSPWPRWFLTDGRSHAKLRIILWGRSWKVYDTVDHLLNAGLSWPGWRCSDLVILMSVDIKKTVIRKAKRLRTKLDICIFRRT